MYICSWECALTWCVVVGVLCSESSTYGIGGKEVFSAGEEGVSERRGIEGSSSRFVASGLGRRKMRGRCLCELGDDESREGPCESE